jgi:hypothetical protein
MIQTEVEEEIVTEEFKNALYYAESGFAHATWLLQHDPQWRDASLSNGTYTMDIQGTITQGATYTIYLSWISQQGTPTSPPGSDGPKPGDVLWRYELPGEGVGSYPYDVQYLNNGHILITEMHGDRRVFELH